jgi:transcription initiation factor TFIIH subunit 3
MVINATPSSTSINENANANTIAKPPAKGGGEMRGGYVGLMNCVFAAQKAVRHVFRPR